MSNYRGNRYYSRSKVCQFCNNKDIEIDYKNVELLKRYIDDVGKIRSRRQTGTCAKHQREVAKAIKNARHIALLPFTGE
ncbi:MAG: 30S ribosomal protein S18 [Chloroflexota bacterium]|jgi:small subunit ribosomal protein S18|nr:30S ribosomal protein S18 [Chloroflexota bacterium]